MLIIPLPKGLPHFTLEVVLDRLTYGLEFLWNTRESAWYSTLTYEGQPIQSGRKLMVGGSPFARSNHANRLAGLMMVFDTSGTDREATLEDLGSRVQLVYFEASERP